MRTQRYQLLLLTEHCVHLSYEKLRCLVLSRFFMQTKKKYPRNGVYSSLDALLKDILHTVLRAS